MIRIISGHLRGKKLFTLPGHETRPTSDRLRETVFNLLLRLPEPARVVDLFAGTGALGIEALSRGAQNAWFVDRSTKALGIIKKNIFSCRLETQARIVKWDVAKNLNCLRPLAKTVDMVFMDPPYEKGLVCPALAHLARANALAPGGVVVVEHTAAEPVTTDGLPFETADQRTYGKTMVTLLRHLATPCNNGR